MNIEQPQEGCPKEGKVSGEQVDALLSSIGLEMMNLAKLLTTEAEKVRSALGALEESGQGPVTFEEIFKTSRSVRAMLRELLGTRLVSGMDFEEILELVQEFTSPMEKK